ncbi:MAG: sodium/solute symporter [Nitrospiraceae bacterium]|nr:sodium/solute symporter [Nitrospiraceae bacterium]
MKWRRETVRTRCLLFFVACFVALPLSALEEPAAQVTPELRDRAIGILRGALAEEERWVKVHAAEALLALGYQQGVAEAFKAELAVNGNEPQYRIGIWRVLARAERTEEARAQYVDWIRAAFLDTSGPDRLHAIETLAKLGHAFSEEEVAAAEAAIAADPKVFAAYGRWALAHSKPADGGEALGALLVDAEARTRSTAAYALRHLGEASPSTLAALTEAARAEAADSTARVYLVSAAWCLASEGAHAAEFEEALRTYAQNGAKGEKYEAAAAFGEVGDRGDLDLLVTMLDDAEADVRVGAAQAILHIGRRVPPRMHSVDWVVIALYVAGLIGVGWYYARRTATREDYLLGGRNMRPLAVGLSMFASLLSTLTYLAIPGEMIKHGPMICGIYLSYPLIFLTVGWFLLPVIMRLRITSAYEILEQRLGVSVRVLGSSFFLALRLMWMAVIVYATSSKVLIPLLDWPASATPIVCLVLGMVTVVYTSMGGLRAVVMTDVVQTVILFGGAGLTLALITYHMGGVGAWWPREWASNWDPLKIAYDPNARITIMGAMTASFTWYVCTAGSDQVAIQRYLATRDVHAARRVIGTSLITDICVGTFLAVLGLALLSYFTSNPHLLPDGQQVYTNSDTLFPRFIVMGLPAGVTGLVVAGLLAAAMSSLSSGLNSSCSVIAIDFIERFRPSTATDTEQQSLRRTKRISVFVGLAVVILSIGVGQVGGNLLEIAYKVVNLLTAPLFVLFFMALFVPWATVPGALAAGIASATMAVGIAYFQWLGLSFVWILPMALLTGVVVGPLVSLLPIGSRKDVEGGADR